MMQRSWRTLLPLVALALLIGYLYAHRNPPPVQLPATPHVAADTPAPATANPQGAAPLPAFLPAEARHTLALITSGGPFPHRQDGTVFGNYEHLLPSESRSYYHEYTVDTPGADNRGARRIITGGNPPTVYYYTNDHYRSFRKFTPPQ